MTQKINAKPSASKTVNAPPILRPSSVAWMKGIMSAPILASRPSDACQARRRSMAFVLRQFTGSSGERHAYLSSMR